MTQINDYLNKIHLGDCMDILRQLPDKSVDLVLTDPPYGINVAKRGKVGGDNCAKSRDYGAKDWDNCTPSPSVFAEILRVSKHSIIFGGNYFVENLKNSPCWIVWNKLNTGNFADCELAWTNFKTGIKKYDILYNGMIKTPSERNEDRIHPTQKPRELFERILSDYSKPGDIILDPFSGSGTTAVACHNLGRQFICVEKDPEYHTASVKQLEQAQKNQFLF